VQVHDFWTKGHIVYDRPDHWVHNKRLKKAFYDEFFTLNIPAAIRKYKKPLLIIHGEKDESVPLKEAQELFQMANKPKKLVIIKDADHRFSQPLHFLKVLGVVKEFIEKR
ncbi:MAG TPA: prolyl oligopeptidase family serine peptidase, partial [Candidatus Nanoarchaeia archaeon]|nr:prolyl oligopeptidase family serine peptidase [Candidatus Nanoarchaeia archaeon]